MAALLAARNDDRSAKSSMGYPVRTISGKTIRCAPSAAAAAAARATSALLPGRSPTVGLIAAMAIRRRYWPAADFIT